MTEPTYVTREDLMSALDVKPTAWMSVRLDRACQAGSRAAEGYCHRTFYPQTLTRTFDWPGGRSAGSGTIWFDDIELLSLTEASTDGDTLTLSEIFLRPDDGPTYNRIELDRDSSAAFAGGPQRAVSLTGLWASAPNTEQQETTLAAAITTAAVTTIDVVAPAGGIGSLLRIGTERLIITGKSWTDSTLTTSALTAAANANTITSASASLFTPGERLLIDAERLEVVDVAGTSIFVRRAVDGSTLAAHSNGTAVYWQHRLTVQRGAVGSTAATSATSAAVYRWIPPSDIATLAQAYAEDTFLQENSGYARTAGQGDNERPVSGRGIAQAEQRCAHRKRGSRVRAV